MSNTINSGPNPYMFVIGCPRSGTTLLQRMLDNHPQLTIANDTHFIIRAAKKVLRKHPLPLLTPELIEAVKSYHRTYRMGLDEKEIERASINCGTYAEFVGNLYVLRGEKKHKPLSGEKTPDYCRQIPALHSLFPATRFVHIIRDGRNTALSTLEWATSSKGPGRWKLWNDDPVATSALWWLWQVGMGQHDGRILGDKLYLQVRYEDLVEDPVAELEVITKFLNIPYSDAMVNYHAGKTQYKSGLSAKSAWLPPVKNLRDWRKNMRSEDIDVFEGIAGALLHENGYVCLGNSASDAASTRIRHALTWWNSKNLG